MKYCPNCGTKVQGSFCSNCGAKFDGEKVVVQNNKSTPNIPYMPQYRPISAWGYFGYSLLFSIPLVGFILLIIYSFNDDNINLRNFARSHWCALILAFIILLVIILPLLLLGIIGSLN